MLSAKSRQELAPMPYLRNQNVQWHRIDLSDVAHMDFTEIERAKYLLQPDDLLICEGGEVGRCARWTMPSVEMCFQKALHRVRPRAGVEIGWLEYFMRWAAETGRFGDRVQGSTIAHLPQRDLRALEVPIPRSAEQRRIVAAIEEHFSRLDAAERALADADRHLHTMYRSVAVDAFDRPDWDWTTLGEIAEVKGGITKDSKREADPEFGEFPYLRVANVQRGYLDLSDVTTIRADRSKAQLLVLRPGDILFNEGGDRDKLGRGWVWEGQIEDCIHQNHVFRARLLDGCFDPYFVSLHANSWGQRWFETHGKQTTNLASLNLTTLKSFPVPAPTLEEQSAVASQLRSALDGIQHQRFELDRVAVRASRLRRSILAEAFAGRLVPQNPLDDSGSGRLAGAYTSAA